MTDAEQEVYGFLDNAEENCEGFKNWADKEILQDMRDYCADLEAFSDNQLLKIIANWKIQQND